MILDRKTAPKFKEVEHVNLISPQLVKLPNGIPLYSINAGNEELIRIEFIFSHLQADNFKPLHAFATLNMLNEGTSKYTSAQIAEKVDFYGAFLQTDANPDQTLITVFTLNKYVDVVLPIVKEILTDSVFPENELSTYKRNQKQRLKVNLEKNDFLARRNFNNALFGAGTIYGFSPDEPDYDQLSSLQLIKYYQNVYQPQNCTIVIAGKVGHQVLKSIEEIFGNWQVNHSFIKQNPAFNGQNAGLLFTEKPDAIQSAIRIGSKSINRNHADFAKLQVLNTILGGYFGSRLMANIREDKGYTYGIGSACVTLQNAGYFFIATEVGVDVCSKALKEIEKEIDILKTDTVSEDELALVKNYMIGSFLGSLENAFSHADKFKNIHFYNLDYTYYDNYLKTVKSISASEIKDLAVKYLDFENFTKVVVGKM